MNNRSLIVALVASLALNLFAVGAVVGGFAVAHRLRNMGPHPRAMMGTGPLWAAADSLSAAHRDAYRQRLHEQAKALADQVTAAREARREAWKSLSAEPVDPGRVSTSLAKARELEMHARIGVEQSIVEFAASLPPDERRKLSEALAVSGGRLEMRHRRPGSPPQRP